MDISNSTGTVNPSIRNRTTQTEAGLAALNSATDLTTTWCCSSMTATVSTHEESAPRKQFRHTDALQSRTKQAEGVQNVDSIANACSLQEALYPWWETSICWCRVHA
jgi:hypothetical protein